MDRHLRIGARLRRIAADRRLQMSTWTLLAAVLAVVLLIYLVAVLVRPEDFS
jgi:K+-transporting ATPase KdpF subunit